MTSKQPAGIDEASLASFVPFFKAFCNPTRASIVEQLLGGERCVCEITAMLNISQPLISHHLAVLRAHRLRADARRRGPYLLLDQLGALR